MRDTKPTLHQSPHDGTLRIHRRRAGTYQPKDSLGLSCIMQVFDEPDVNQSSSSSTRRKTLAAPRDNIGISCLPTKDSLRRQQEMEDIESDIANYAALSPRQHRIKKTEDYLTRMRGGGDPLVISDSIRKVLNRNGQLPDESDESLNEGNVTKKESKTAVNIGISNIRRPKSSKTKTRKPILPRDHIGFCCQILQKPSVSKTSIGSSEKRIRNEADKNKSIKQTRSAVTLKGKKSTTSCRQDYWK